MRQIIDAFPYARSEVLLCSDYRDIRCFQGSGDTGQIAVLERGRRESLLEEYDRSAMSGSGRRPRAV
jgi:hypothetical protein